MNYLACPQPWDNREQLRSASPASAQLAKYRPNLLFFNLFTFLFAFVCPPNATDPDRFTTYF